MARPPRADMAPDKIQGWILMTVGRVVITSGTGNDTETAVAVFERLPVSILPVGNHALRYLFRQDGTENPDEEYGAGCIGNNDEQEGERQENIVKNGRQCHGYEERPQ